jgi:hypothetical protein
VHGINYLLYCNYLNTVNWLSSIQASGILTNWQNITKSNNKKIEIIIFIVLLQKQCCAAHRPISHVAAFTVTTSSAIILPHTGAITVTVI